MQNNGSSEVTLEFLYGTVFAKQVCSGTTIIAGENHHDNIVSYNILLGTLPQNQHVFIIWDLFNINKKTIKDA